MVMDMTKIASNLIAVKGNAEVSSVIEAPKEQAKKKSLLVKLDELQASKLKDAVYKTDKTKQTIMTEALELWFRENNI